MTKKVAQGDYTNKSETDKVISSLSEIELLKAFEDIQQKLVELYRLEGSFVNPAVLQLSQQLDEYIVAIQKLKAAR
ncbi:hypothetical protein C4A76_24095 [Brevibacillus laterosporus]|uniref:Aspartyl-phosphate phosphatase Spo0E family protein n=1 Tax=Brevibacillus laterosporus TaxID=1465 RepID=A0AAP8QF26_BRELA|nr:hypothetical protein C4A76_24095 [Brevibacillus laterosporus]PPB08900.1 hypothetical protein C4A77_06330 [Brevibacillus laterosporus]